MTMHADQLVGAPVTDSDGLAVGTVEQVFRDDVDGTPSWARIRSSKGLHFVPLTGSNLTSSGGLSVPFDAQKILSEPDISVDRHMSVDQEEELRRYFGVSVPAQAPPGDDEITKGKAQEAETGTAETGVPGAGQPGQAETMRQAQPGLVDQPGLLDQPGTADQTSTTQPDLGIRTGEPSDSEAGAQWLTRSEERFVVELEPAETGRVKLHKYVDTESVQETISVYHEEYEIERIPVSADDQQPSGDIAEGEQEIILHEARPVVSKETVPVERIRLSVRKVEEPKTITGEIRKERIEIDSDTIQPDDPAAGI